MKFKTLILSAMCIISLVGMTGCKCKHESWIDANCTTAKICEECGATEGEPLGHEWKEADCKNPKTCEVCGETEGEPLEHKWIDADCENPKTCEVCGETEGEPLEHKWIDADCENPKTCEVCGKTEGKENGHSCETELTCTDGAVCKTCKKEIEPLGHNWKNASCTEPKTCLRCNATEGEALGHTYVSGYCKFCGDEQKILIYDDSYVSVYYTGINCLGSVDLYLYAENKSNQDLGITIKDPSINGSMVYFGGYMNLSAGKNAKEEYYFNLTDEYGYFNSADSIEFKLNINDNNTYDTIVKTDSITIDVKNNTVSTSSGGGNATSLNSTEDLNKNAIGRLNYVVPDTVSDSSGFESLDDSYLKEMKDNSSKIFINSYGLIGDTYTVHYVLPYFADEYSDRTYDYDDFLYALQDVNKADYGILKAYYGSGSFHAELVVSIDIGGNEVIVSFRDGLRETDNTMNYFN